VEFERDTTNKVSEVVGPSDDVRVLCGCSATNGDGPTMSMFMGGVGLTFFWGQNDGGVSIYDGSIDRKALERKGIMRENAVWRGTCIP
jgi:hypothetical protein